MELQHGSVVDTMVAFAKQYLPDQKIELDTVKQRMQGSSVQDHVDIIEIMRSDDIGGFVEFMSNSDDSEEVTEYVSPGGQEQKYVNDMNKANKQATRDQKTGRGMAKQPVSGTDGGTPGARNIKPTGGPQGHSPANKNMNAQDIQRMQNSQGIQQNASEVEQLKHVVARMQALSQSR